MIVAPQQQTRRLPVFAHHTSVDNCHLVHVHRPLQERIPHMRAAFHDSRFLPHRDNQECTRSANGNASQDRKGGKNECKTNLGGGQNCRVFHDGAGHLGSGTEENVAKARAGRDAGSLDDIEG